MWSAISSVVALVLVAALNIGLIAAAGGNMSPTTQVMTTALWALQAPIAAILIGARREKTEQDPATGAIIAAPAEAKGESVLALVVVFTVGVFVTMQLSTVVFGGVTFAKDYLVQSLCGLGHADRCAQIPQDAEGATQTTILIAGGMFSIIVGMVAFGVAGYRIGWRARRLAWLGALLVPVFVVIVMFVENLVSLSVMGMTEDSMLATLDPVTLALARAPLMGVGLVFGALGYLLSRRLNVTVRRYGRSVTRASPKRAKTTPAKLKAEFLTVLGFSAAEYELVVRRRQSVATAPTPEADIKT